MNEEFTELHRHLEHVRNHVHPVIAQELGIGEFGTLRAWLTEQVYRHGRKFEPNEVVQRATGAPLQSTSYLRYLNQKFGQLYGL